MSTFTGFPRVIAEIIAGYIARPRLLQWIPSNRLVDKGLLINPLAFDAWGIDMLAVMERFAPSFLRGHLVQNPAMEEHIRAWYAEGDDSILHYAGIWENPAVIDILLDAAAKDPKQVNWKWLSRNPHPKAVELLMANLSMVQYQRFSMNPTAWPHISPRRGWIDFVTIGANPAAIDIIIKNELYIKKYGQYLSLNPHPWVIKYLQTHLEEIDWENFSSNPGIFEFFVDPEMVLMLTCDSPPRKHKGDLSEWTVVKRRSRRRNTVTR